MSRYRLQINVPLITRIIGTIFFSVGIFMLIPVLISIFYREKEWVWIAISSDICFGIGLFLRNFTGRKTKYVLRRREGFIIVGIIWILTPILGAFPYIFCNVLPNFTDAYFESLSGFTSTGASVISDVEVMPKGLLVWRSLSQWIGGLGLTLFSIMIIKRLREGAGYLYLAEFSGTIKEKQHPRMAKFTSRLWLVYALLTLGLFFTLLIIENDPIHSLCLAFSTIATGGFSPVNDNLSHFSTATQIVVMIYMFISAMSIVLIYQILTGKFKKAFSNNEQLKWYIGIILLFSTIIFAILLIDYNTTVGNSIKNALFVTISTLSTTGYYLSDIYFSGLSILLIIFILMFIGGFSGSTTGGLKIIRVITLLKYIRAQFKRMVHPQAILQFKVNNEAIRPDKINIIFGFCFLYILFFLGGTMVLCLCGDGLIDSMSMSASILGNIGPAIGNICTDCSYVELPQIAKWAMCVLMIAGKVEIFSLIALFTPKFWRS